MCGICGVVSFDGRPVNGDVVRDMMGTIAHRGPDAQGVFLDGSVGLGHLRLAIVDLSESGTQPMTNEDGSLWIVINGEVYNFRELRARLEAAGHPFRSHTDTEVVLHLYEEMGDRCIDALEGMFALALWDGRRRRLLLARDRVGKKPLYMYRDRRFLAFASEIKALLRHPDVEDALDQSSIPRYFLHGYVPAPQTFYRGVRALMPGTVMTVEADGREQVRQYWDLDFPSAAAARPARDMAAHEDRLRELVTGAVAKRLIADVPIGAFLSGGIDSTIVVGLMSRLVSEPVRTFTIGFVGDPAFDETAYARIVADRFKTRHTEFVVEPRQIELVETLVHHHDGPFADASAVPTYLLSQLTREHVTVALSGDGGDELFAGYRRFHAGVLSERVPSPVARIGDWVLSRLPEPASYHSRMRVARRFLQSRALPLPERFAQWIALFHADLEALLGPSLLDAPVDKAGYFHPYLEKSARYSPLGRLLYLNTKTYLPDDLLVKADRCSMAHGLEVRSPFLDHPLMEWVAALPDQWKLRGGTTKHILRRAFADLLPPAVAAGGKRGFGVPLGAWFRGPLAEYVGDVLGPGALSREWLNGRHVEHLLDEHRRGLRDHGLRLWTLLTFEVWLRLMRRERLAVRAAV